MPIQQITIQIGSLPYKDIPDSCDSSKKKISHSDGGSDRIYTHFESIHDVLKLERKKENHYLNYNYKTLFYANRVKKYFKRVFKIKITDYLPETILGMTDCNGNIWIRRLYGYLKKHVLKHEINHNLFPDADEYKIRKITDAGYPYDLSQFEFIYC